MEEVIIYVFDKDGYYTNTTPFDITEGFIPEFSTLTPIPPDLKSPKFNIALQIWEEGYVESTNESINKRLDQLTEENKLLKLQVQVNSQISDFHEELIAEIAMKVYQ